MGDVLRQYLEKVEKTIDVAFLYGSYAKGEETATSDVDLFVVGHIAPKELAKLLAPARPELGREIDPITMDREEFRAKAKGKDHFVSAILRDPKLFLVGNAADLEALAGRRQTEKA